MIFTVIFTTPALPPGLFPCGCPASAGSGLGPPGCAVCGLGLSRAPLCSRPGSSARPLPEHHAGVFTAPPSRLWRLCVLSLASCVSASGLGPLPEGRARTCRLHGALGRSRRCSSSRWQAPCSRPPAHTSARAWSVCGTGGQASIPQRLLSPGLLLSLFVSSPIVHTFSPVRKDRVEVSGGLTCRVVMDPMLGRCDDWKGLNRDSVAFYLFGF